LTPLKLKNILITGASSGLGRALAKRFAGPGVHLGLLGRNENELNITADLCRKQGATVVTACLDLRQRQALQDWIAGFDEKYRIDLVIANAGVMHALKPDRLPEPAAIIDETFATNFTGVTDTVNPLLHKMAARGGGSVVIISSLSAYHGLPSFPAYAASKAALKSYYEALRGLFARKKVIITLVCPGYISTRMTESLRIHANQLMDADRTAARIERGIRRGDPLITFPRYQAFGLQILGWLPQVIADRILLLYFRL
jgi:short-subunit dehydrogenase